MPEFLATLTHGKRFKAAVKELPSDDLKALATRLERIIAGIETQATATLEKEAERNAKIEIIRKQMTMLGLCINDINSPPKPTRGKNERRPAKYMIEVNGQIITWTGLGRRPTVFNIKLDEGFALNDFLIK
ncbi:DNA-binding protein H-NS [Shewanella psychrophila]|uniref:DNA-binding protein n=1 Tax=Shewanella psychrophila TaxID=225848 RepID=A0A1S6HN07_9GAMM|nr:H-NS family nucleoid-associated regulatory protein [Shewanella psychrophila]AQS36888.1 DNA-binding protein H-NS [Shewanella psychrophila]